jgi:hypothetical protein
MIVVETVSNLVMYQLLIGSRGELLLSPAGQVVSFLLVARPSENLQHSKDMVGVG